MISGLVVLSVIKKFWLPIVCILGLLTISALCYYKGKRDCEAKMNRAVIEELLRQEEETNRLLTEGNRIKVRTNSPLTDEEASCILSNNPFKVRCVD